MIDHPKTYIFPSHPGTMFVTKKDFDAMRAMILEEVRSLEVAGSDLAKITECFCDDLTAYQGTCETCLWQANYNEFQIFKNGKENPSHE